MFKRLRVRLTVVCTLITGLILALMAAGALLIAREQQQSSSILTFRSDYNSIVLYLQTQAILDRSWMAQTESGNRLVLHIEDNGLPLQYKGTWKTISDRAKLIERAQEQALHLGFYKNAPPASRINANSLFYEFRGDQGERYRSVSASVPTPDGWVGLTLLKDMREEDAQALLQTILFAGLTVVGTLLLGIFSFFFTKRLVQPIEESQQRQTAFIASASHELRTPLAVIQTSISAVSRADEAEQAHFCGIASGQCRRMSRLIEDMLTLARADSHAWSMQLRSVDLQTLLVEQSELFEETASQKDIRLTVELGDVEELLPPVRGDAERLSQVLAILIDNAVSYTPVGGRVRLGACATEDGNSVRLTVSDTGPGIPPEHIGRIFERFYRAEQARSDQKHYGLGLSIAKEIVELHRGRIGVANRQDGGCTFTIELPAGRAPSEHRRHGFRSA